MSIYVQTISPNFLIPVLEAFCYRKPHVAYPGDIISVGDDLSPSYLGCKFTFTTIEI